MALPPAGRSAEVREQGFGWACTLPDVSCFSSFSRSSLRSSQLCPPLVNSLAIYWPPCADANRRSSNVRRFPAEAAMPDASHARLLSPPLNSCRPVSYIMTVAAPFSPSLHSLQKNQMCDLFRFIAHRTRRSWQFLPFQKGWLLVRNSRADWMTAAAFCVLLPMSTTRPYK